MAEYPLGVRLFLSNYDEVEQDMDELSRKNVEVRYKFDDQTGNYDFGGGVGRDTTQENLGNMFEGAISGAFTKYVLPLIGIDGLLKALEFIGDNTQNMADRMADINPALAEQQKMLENTMNLALMPMSQLMNTLMKPYLTLMLMRARKGMEEAKPILEALKSGEIDYEQALEGYGNQRGLNAIFEETASIMYVYQNQLNEQTKDITASMAGYTSGVELATSNWYVGVSNWLDNFLDGLTSIDENFLKNLPEIKEDMEQAFGESQEVLKLLPEGLRELSEMTFDDALAKSIRGSVEASALRALVEPLGLLNFADDLKQRLKDNIIDPIGAVQGNEQSFGFKDSLASQLWNKLINPTGEEGELFITGFNKKLKEITDGLKMPEIEEVSMLDVMKTVLKSLKGWSLDKLSAITADDFILTSSGQLIKTNPEDTIIGTKTPESLMNGGGKIIHITNHIALTVTGSMENEVVPRLVELLTDELKAKMNF